MKRGTLPDSLKSGGHVSPVPPGFDVHDLSYNTVFESTLLLLNGPFIILFHFCFAL